MKDCSCNGEGREGKIDEGSGTAQGVRSESEDEESKEVGRP